MQRPGIRQAASAKAVSTANDPWGYQRAVRETLDSAIDQIVQKFAPEKVILFGSYAWGEPGPESDVDLLIIKETNDTRALARAIDHELFDRRFPIDILVYKPDRIALRLEIGDSFVRKVMQHGKVLYDRQRSPAVPVR